MAATVTLAYDCAVGNQNPNNLVARIAAVNITEELPPLGMNVSSDVTAVNGAVVRRTIVLNCTSFTNSWFPSDDLVKAATFNLYSMKLALQGVCSVIAADPVVA